ncbi:class I SAM-dependent methyltransferase [Nonomuraea guangzhouensis]|uniref:Class I SAM-dependent methyltransferase n=1 Tax=Nonomuraea guangzhouensis TaxID=1291555 RepID=A0ABW4G048_9ACTN|nr:class I SAM-dependent methyltransferase [Nonomuraea guangzhouensis]
MSEPIFPTAGSPSDPIAVTTAGYDRIASVFDARTKRPDDVFVQHRQRFADTISSSGTVADLGCGPGRDAAWLAGLGHRVVGVDLSPGMARLAAARGVPVLLGDLRRPPLAPGSLTGLWSSAALLHVPPQDTEDTLRTWSQTLRPGGALGLSTSAGDGEGWESVPYATEVRRWFVHRDPRALLNLLARTGFEVVGHGLHTTYRTWLSVIAVRR